MTEDSTTGKMLKSLGAETHQGTVSKGGEGCIEVIEIRRRDNVYRNNCNFGVITSWLALFSAYDSGSSYPKHTKWRECWDDRRPEWVLGAVKKRPFFCCYWNPTTKEHADPEQCGFDKLRMYW